MHDTTKMKEKRKKYKMTTYGEYEFVVRKVYSASAIKRAHEIKITRRQVLNIIKKLSKRYFKDENKVWVWWLSKDELWNTGGVLFDDERQPVIELINTKKNLRVGIVLHEFAHAFAGHKYGIINHGKIFIKTFNKVLRFYYTQTKKNS